MQFSLRRLFLALTIVAAMARVRLAVEKKLLAGKTVAVDLTVLEGR